MMSNLEDLLTAAYKSRFGFGPDMSSELATYVADNLDESIAKHAKLSSLMSARRQGESSPCVIAQTHLTALSAALSRNATNDKTNLSPSDETLIS